MTNIDMDKGQRTEQRKVEDGSKDKQRCAVIGERSSEVILQRWDFARASLKYPWEAWT